MEMLDLVYKLREALDKDNCHPKHENVFYVSDGIIAKAGTHVRKQIEFESGKLLFDNGIKVPEMYSIIKSPFSEKEWFSDVFKDSWFVFMQRLDGIPLSEYSGNNYENLRLKWVEELKKAQKLGVSLEDMSDENTLVVNDEIFLIDFEHAYIEGKHRPKILYE